MFVRILIVGLCLTVALGCAKRVAKKPAADDDTAEKAKPLATPSAADNKKVEEPNWLNDPRFKKEGDGPALPVETPPNGKPGWGLPKGDYTAPPPAVPPMPAGVPVAPPAAGLPQPEPVKPPAPVKPAPPVATTPTAPKFSPVTEADMKDVWTYIENASGATGKMPSQALIFQTLIGAESKAAPLVKDGSIYLTGAKTRESVWAFEARALTQGGLVVTHNGVETLTAAELKKRLGK